MNRTYIKGSSWQNPCPAYTGVGTMNESGTLYVICDSMFYDPTEQVETPMSSTTIALAVSLAIILAVILVCSIQRKKKHLRVYSLE